MRGIFVIVWVCGNFFSAAAQYRLSHLKHRKAVPCSYTIYLFEIGGIIMGLKYPILSLWFPASKFNSSMLFHGINLCIAYLASIEDYEERFWLEAPTSLTLAVIVICDIKKGFESKSFFIFTNCHVCHTSRCISRRDQTETLRSWRTKETFGQLTHIIALHQIMIISRSRKYQRLTEQSAVTIDNLHPLT